MVDMHYAQDRMATELLGNTQTSTYTYMTAPRLNGLATPSFLPSIGLASASVKPYDTYPAPVPLRRAVTCMPWRSSYFGVSRGDPDVPHMRSMPEQLSERSRTDIDSFKVSDRATFCRSVNQPYTDRSFSEAYHSQQPTKATATVK